MAEDTSEPGLQRAVLRPTRACRRFDERRPQPVVALPGLARLVSAGALIVSRTERRPTREMGGGGKRAHVHTDLRDEYFGRPPAEAGNAIQAGQRSGERSGG